MTCSVMSGGSSWPRLHFLGNAAHGVHDFNAAAVAQRHDERQPVVFGKRRDGFLQMLLHVFRQAVDLADDFEPHVVLVQLRRLGFEVMDEIFHQRVHLVLGPVPVLGRKGVEREIFDAQFARGADDDARGFRALRGGPRCAAGCRCFAQRPLPSMMMATCRGRWLGFALRGTLRDCDRDHRPGAWRCTSNKNRLFARRADGGDEPTSRRSIRRCAFR